VAEDADTIDTRDLSTLSNGVRMFTNRGSRAIIEIPGGLEGVKVKPVIGDVIDPTEQEIPLLFAVDAPGSGSLLVRDTVDPSDADDDDFLDEGSFRGTDDDGAEVTALDFNEETREMDVSDLSLDDQDMSQDGGE
jgi:hypothetical protein